MTRRRKIAAGLMGLGIVSASTGVAIALSIGWGLVVLGALAVGVALLLGWT